MVGGHRGCRRKNFEEWEEAKGKRTVGRRLLRKRCGEGGCWGMNCIRTGCRGRKL